MVKVAKMTKMTMDFQSLSFNEDSFHYRLIFGCRLILGAHFHEKFSDLSYCRGIK